MSIIHFPDTHEKLVRRNHEEGLDGIISEMESLLMQTPQQVKDIVDSEYIAPKEVIVINLTELKALIIDYIIYQISQSKIDFNRGTTLGLEYLANLLFEIFQFKSDEIKIVIENPYYSHWIEQGFPKRAGDASVYAYMFKGFENKSIKRDDYVGFAINGYYEYSGDIDFSRSVGTILPIIGNMGKDENFLKRGNIRAL